MKKEIILASIFCLMLCGCGKKNSVKDDFADVQGTVVEDTQEEDTEQSNASTSGLITVNYEIDSKIKVNAEVDTSIPSNLQVYNVSEFDVTDERMLEIAKNIFDGGECKVMRSEDSYSLGEQEEMLREIKAETEKRAETTGRAYQTSRKFRYLSSCINDNISNVECNLADGQIIADYEEVDVSEHIGIIQGNINGELYELYYSKLEIPGVSSALPNHTDFLIYPVNGAPYKQGCVSFDSMDDPMITENACDYEDALQMAKDMVADTGLSDYALRDCYALIEDPSLSGVVTDYSTNLAEAVVPNGYRFAFTPNMYGMSVGYYPYTSAVIKDYVGSDTARGDLITTNQPSIVVDIDNTGIVNVELNHLIEVQASISTDTNIIPFEQADELARDAFKNTIDDYNTINGIVLEYVVAKYDDEMVMFPAWVYQNNNDNTDTTVIAVNAMDGSLLYYIFTYVKAF